MDFCYCSTQSVDIQSLGCFRQSDSVCFAAMKIRTLTQTASTVSESLLGFIAYLAFLTAFVH